MNKNIVLCGVGGQGTVLASKLIAAAAMKKNIPVMSAETIGMAQKGGSVFSFLRMGENISGPMLMKGSADIIIAFEPAEAVRMLPYLKDGGIVVTNINPVMPVTSTLSASSYCGEEMTEYLKSNVENVYFVDGLEACEKLGSPKALNMVLLGTAVNSGILDISLDDIIEVMKERVKPEFVEMNIKALTYYNQRGE